MTTPLIGLYGLGTMGAALALNMAEHGIHVHVANRTTAEVPVFLDRAGPLGTNITAHDDIDALIAALPKPRTILFMIPSTKPMDDMIDFVIPKLSPGDTVIDAGNADFNDTRRRDALLREHELHFVGMGVSGGEEGARHGPSIMVGGTEHSWAQLEPVTKAIAAQHEGDPCVAHLGPDGAGHFVKTVHNGIEYADMQLIAEIHGLLHHGAGRSHAEIGDLFTEWDRGPLKSYLVEITGRLLHEVDPQTGRPVVDIIKDSAGQKGTGRWTVIEAIRMGQSATMIEAAVASRAWSSEGDLRAQAAALYGEDRGTLEIDDAELAKAFSAARVLDYAQGFRILRAASAEFGWDLDYARIAEIWRAGCIIRSALLDDISAAFRNADTGGELILAPAMAEILKDGIPALRALISKSLAAGHATPALASALGWFDTMRQSRGQAHIIQGQRDIFGRHGFERIDATGPHHGPWWG
ncbi:6-phosphogluconate dehydrogenase [Poseidonocella pacifica]|uniref:6-phosphogluconate dehydrogenase, decarboxylating n=1 Tax=Poseidonocella pacifica TaxID=871651 RepID=A0A1I0WBT5_9RHOB|nr:NADP-dependent phosphogluconate dehydrogenase [Poseidonocella pacifica]SFA86071.1 6-phosphogluconate dehydrogenase [Poseidonocella pacifica]